MTAALAVVQRRVDSSGCAPFTLTIPFRVATGSGGSATFSGTVTQGSVAAYVAVYLLARQPLNWLELNVQDVPTAILGETLGPGDDIRIELLATEHLLEVQSKHGLRVGRRLDETFATIAAKLPTYPQMHVLVAVDPTSSKAVRSELRDDLVRVAHGRTDDLAPITEHVRTLVAAAGGDTLLARVRVVELDLDYLSSSHTQLCLTVLRQILDNESQAEAAYEVLNQECARICRFRDRGDYESLSALLRRRGIRLRLQTRVIGGHNVPDTPDSVSTSGPATPATPPAATRDPATVRVASVLETAKDLLDAGKAPAALAVLEQLEEATRARSLDDEIRAVLYARLGTSQLRLGRFTEAKGWLERALLLDGAYFAALLNLGILLAWQGDDAGALPLLDRALVVQPASALAWAHRGFVAVRLGVPNSPPAAMTTNPEYIAAAANLALTAGDWVTAERLAREAIRTGSRTVDILMIFSIAAFNAKYQGRIEGSAVAAEDVARLREIEATTTEVISSFAGDTSDLKLADALTLRGSARRVLGSSADAESDFEEALKSQPGSKEPAYQLALLRLLRGDALGALSAADAGHGEDGQPDGRLLTIRARALLQLGRPREVEEALRQAIERARGTDDEMPVRMNGADVAIHAGLLALAEELVAGVAAEREQWLVHLWRARIAAKDGRHDDARREYKSACDSAAAHLADSRSAHAEYAIYLAREGAAQEAVPLFEAAGAADAEAPDEWKRGLAQALYDTDDLSRLNALVADFRFADPTPLWALDFDARIAHRQGDIPREIAALEELRRRNPLAHGATIYLADAYARALRLADGARLVEELAGVSTLTVLQRLQLADIALRVERAEVAIAVAYETARAQPDEPSVQMAYLNILLTTERKALALDPSVVAAGTTVTIRNRRHADDTLTYVILPRDDMDARGDEVRPADPSIADLIGLGVGEKVVRRRGELSEATYDVSEIKSTYVHAFQNILKQFPKRFPQNTALQAFRIGETPTIADFAPIVEGTAQHAERADSALAFHENQLLPLSSVAAIAGSDVRAVMYALSGEPGRRLRIESGAIRQFSASVDAAGSTGPVVLTRSALVTAQDSELLPLLVQMYGRLLVPVSLLQDIDKELAEWGRGEADGLHYMVKAGDTIRISETPAPVVKAQMASLQMLKDWVGTQCELVPRPLNSFGAGRDELRDKLGHSAFDSCAVASDRGARLYADDLGLRSLAEAEYDVRGFSTYAVLTAAEMQGAIDATMRDREVVKLIVRNYYFIPLNVQLLYYVYSANGFALNRDVLRVLDRLADPDLVVELGVAVAAGLVREVALSTAGVGAIPAITTACLEALTRGRVVLSNAGAFQRAALTQLALLPGPQDEVTAAIRRFLEARLRS